MKKHLRYIVSLTVLLVTAFLLYEILVKIDQKKEVERYTQSFSYIFTLTDSTAYDLKNTLGQTSMVVFFNPGCEHCEYEGDLLKKNQRKMANVQVLMVSMSPRDSIIAYSKRYGLDMLSNFHFATDSLFTAHTKFGVQTIPTIFIYGKDGNLRKKFVGEVRIEAVLRELE